MYIPIVSLALGVSESELSDIVEALFLTASFHELPCNVHCVSSFAILEDRGLVYDNLQDVANGIVKNALKFSWYERLGR